MFLYTPFFRSVLACPLSYAWEILSLCRLCFTPRVAQFPQAFVQMSEYTSDNLRSRLSIPLGGHEVRALAQLLCQPANAPLVDTVCALLADDDKRVGDNAAWVLLHCGRYADEWLRSKCDMLMELGMHTSSQTRCRLLLGLLLRQTHAVCTNVVFLDFCLSRMRSTRESASIRVLCMKLACGQCRPYPELLDELRLTLEDMAEEPMSSGLRNAWKKAITDCTKSADCR